MPTLNRNNTTKFLTSLEVTKEWLFLTLRCGKIKKNQGRQYTTGDDKARENKFGPGLPAEMNRRLKIKDTLKKYGTEF